MPPNNFERQDPYYGKYTVRWTPLATERLRDDIAEQALEESDLIEARMVLAYIMQKR